MEPRLKQTTTNMPEFERSDVLQLLLFECQCQCYHMIVGLRKNHFPFRCQHKIAALFNVRSAKTD